jgi:hypothetical protein
MGKNENRTKEIPVFNVGAFNVMSSGLLVIFYFFALISTNALAQSEFTQVKIAFIADIHLHAPGGKRDFINREGVEVSVMSPSHQECMSGRSDFCSELLKEWGYKEIAQSLSEHGFLPSPEDKLFETPFNTVDLDERHWQWCDTEEFCVYMPDMSYLVEPVEGLWLLAIDANVYRPKGSLKDKQFSGLEEWAGYTQASYMFWKTSLAITNTVLIMSRSTKSSH